MGCAYGLGAEEAGGSGEVAGRQPEERQPPLQLAGGQRARVPHGAACFDAADRRVWGDEPANALDQPCSTLKKGLAARDAPVADYGGRNKRIDYSEPLVPSAGNMEEMLREHERTAAPSSAIPTSRLASHGRRALHLHRVLPSPSRALPSPIHRLLSSFTTITQQNSASTTPSTSRPTRTGAASSTGCCTGASRRGFLELDLVLGSWVEQHIHSMDEANIRALLQVLDLSSGGARYVERDCAMRPQSVHVRSTVSHSGSTGWSTVGGATM
ncbi:hypothetical protein ABZP36_009260 [Zizania latifolia]